MMPKKIWKKHFMEIQKYKELDQTEFNEYLQKFNYTKNHENLNAMYLEFPNKESKDDFYIFMGNKFKNIIFKEITQIEYYKN
jgi:hypothetical protein